MATASSPTGRPAFVRDEYLEYLDELFECYAVDIGRAGPMLCADFDIAESDARYVVAFWASRFGNRLDG